jgi:uncharacterized protein
MMRLDWTCGELAEGLCCYRAGEFFEAHEHWESVWLESGEPEKTFLQSLIQVAAAFHHYRRGNLRGLKSLLQTALRKLERYPEAFGGIEVASLCEEIHMWLKSLETEEEHISLCIPRIRFTGAP